MPTPASGSVGANPKSSSPTIETIPETRRTGHAAEPVDQAGAEQPDEGHRADEDPEHRAADGLGLAEAVDDRERQPVVGGPLGQGGRHDDDADQQRAAARARSPGRWRSGGGGRR